MKQGQKKGKINVRWEMVGSWTSFGGIINKNGRTIGKIPGLRFFCSQVFLLLEYSLLNPREKRKKILDTIEACW